MHRRMALRPGLRSDSPANGIEDLAEGTAQIAGVISIIIAINRSDCVFLVNKRRRGLLFPGPEENESCVRRPVRIVIAVRPFPMATARGTPPEAATLPFKGDFLYLPDRVAVASLTTQTPSECPAAGGWLG
jgi:hypothetical protein